MLFWSAMMFFLGIAAFLDSVFNYGEIFRQVNSVLFLLMALGILVRTTTKMKAGKMEEYMRRVEDLEYSFANMAREKEKAKKKEASLY